MTNWLNIFPGSEFDESVRHLKCWSKRQDRYGGVS